ncbi:radical SAM protein, partial [candidate division KSB1 bacterium]
TCEYCFYCEKQDLFPDSKKHRMSENILEEMTRQFLDNSSGLVNFAWQGGEPTLMGLDFYKKAVGFQKKYGQGHTIGNGFQTNGILINDLWAEFFRDNKFLIGLSLDGPEHVHNKYRVMLSSEGSWKKRRQCAD